MLSDSEASEATVGWQGCQGAGQLRPSQPRTSGAPASLGGAQLACALAAEDRRTCLSWHARGSFSCHASLPLYMTRPGHFLMA